MLIYEQLHGLSKYGELTTLRMGSVTWVLLNSDRVISEIIAKRENVTSERPYLPIASGLVSRDRRTVLRQTAHWTEGRIMMHYLLTGTALKSYGNGKRSRACNSSPHISIGLTDGTRIIIGIPARSFIVLC